MTTATKYTFGDGSNDFPLKGNSGGGRTKHRNSKKGHGVRKNSEDLSEPDPTDGSGSLTYSAASSINSAGESTDSSFADIMRVLDMQDGNNPEIANLLHKSKHGHGHYPQGHPKSSSRSSAASVASSLQYSTDSQSHFLHGADIISTITGQPSDSYAYDGGNLGAIKAAAMGASGGMAHDDYNNTCAEKGEPFGENNIMFAPAEPAESLKRRKQMKRNKHNINKDSSSTPRSKNSHHSSSLSPSASSSSSKGSSSKSKRRSPSSSRSHSPTTTTNSSWQAKSNNNTPKCNTINGGGTSTPPIPPPMRHTIDDDDDICYAQWWMSCFPDAFKNLMPKR